MSFWLRLRRASLVWALAVVAVACGSVGSSPAASPDGSGTAATAPSTVTAPPAPSATPQPTALAVPASSAPSPAVAAPTIEVPGVAVRLISVGFAYTAPFAVDKVGNLYVPTGARGAALTKIAPDGKVLATYTGRTVVTGQPDAIAGVAIDPKTGDVWASDATSDRILHLTAGLEPIGSFGATGLGDGQFSSPGGLAILPDGSVAVADMGADRLEIFRQDGTFVRKVQSPGGKFAPYDVAADATGHVWLTGSQPGGPYDGRPVGAAVEVAADGSVVRTLTTRPGGLLWFPSVAASGDTVYVADAWQGLLSATGTKDLAPFASIPGGGEAPAVVRLSPAGNIYANACRYGQSDCTITEFAPDGTRLASWHLSGQPDHGGQAYTVNGRAMFLQCIGTGSPTIVWIAGAQGPGWLTTAQYLQGRLATISRVCVYDRQGLGFSDAAGYGDMTHWRQDVADLSALLAKAKVTGPFVMAGHSYGGLLARVFAYQLPKQVVGVLAIDPSSEEQFSQTILNPDAPKGDPTCTSCPFYPDIVAIRAMTGGKVAGSLGKLPFIVIGHAPDVPFWPSQDYDGIWLQLGLRTATASSNAIHVTASWSGHSIPTSQPALVVEALRELVAAAGAQSHTLPACGSAMRAVGGTCD